MFLEFDLCRKGHHVVTDPFRLGTLTERTARMKPHGRAVVVYVGGVLHPALLARWVRVDGKWHGLACWVVLDRFEIALVAADQLRLPDAPIVGSS